MVAISRNNVAQDKGKQPRIQIISATGSDRALALDGFLLFCSRLKQKRRGGKTMEKDGNIKCTTARNKTKLAAGIEK